jgi:hypothetical protein
VEKEWRVGISPAAGRPPHRSRRRGTRRACSTRWPPRPPLSLTDEGFGALGSNSEREGLKWVWVHPTPPSLAGLYMSCGAPATVRSAGRPGSSSSLSWVVSLASWRPPIPSEDAQGMSTLQARRHSRRRLRTAESANTNAMENTAAGIKPNLLFISALLQCARCDIR